MEDLTVKQLQEYCRKTQCSVSIYSDGEFSEMPDSDDETLNHNFEIMTERVLGAQSDPVGDGKPNWDDAPCGATHYDPTCDYEDYAWMKQNSSGHWYFYNKASEKWESVKVEFLRRHGHDPKDFIPRPDADIAARIKHIESTLAERENRYGDFAGHAELTQGLKFVMASSRNWGSLPDDMKEALEMIAHKIGRILNGDPEYIDSWHDIIGYARIVEQRLEEEQSNG